MASTYASNPYRGQSQFLPAGYMEAATAPGRSIAAGIQQAGAAMGEGLGNLASGYIKSKKEKDLLEASVLKKVALATSSAHNIEDYLFEKTTDEKGNEQWSPKVDDAAAMELYSDIKKGAVKGGDLNRKDLYRLSGQLDAFLEASENRKIEARQRVEDQRLAEKHRMDRQGHAAKMEAIADQKKRQAEANLVADINAQIAMGKLPTTRTEETRDVVSAPMTPEQEQQLIATGGVPYAPDSQVGRYIEQQRKANDPLAKYDYENFISPPQAQPVPQTQPVPQAQPVQQDQAASQFRPGEKDLEFTKQTLARALDSVSQQVGSSKFNRLPPGYNLGGGWEYGTREPGDIPDGLADYVPTGRKMRGREITKAVPNFKRIGAFIQQLKADGVNTPELRQLEYLVNPRTAAGQAPRQIEDYRQAVPATAAALTPVMSTPAPVERPMMPEIVQGTREVPLTATERDAALVEMSNRTPGFSELPPRDQFAILQQQRKLRAGDGPAIYNASGRQFIKQPNGSFSELSERGEKVSRPTEAQAKALQFASELSYVNEELEKIQRNYNPEGWIASFARSLPTFLQGDTTKAYSNMVDKWIEAALRDRSGAAIAEHEYDGARRQFFPVIGDSPENIERKRRLRDVATQAMIQRAKGIPVEQIDFSFRKKENGEKYETKAAVKTEEVKLADGRSAIIETEN